MMGEVVSDLKIIPLGHAVTQMKTGSTPSTTHPEYFGGDIPWFTPGDIGSSKDLANSMRTITQDAVSFGKAKLFEKGMLLVTCIGDIGRVGILEQTSSSNQQITALKFNDDIDVDFAYYWFISNKQKLVDLANQAIVPILNNERLSEINFAYPPLTEQKRIASLLRRADRLRQLRRTAHDLGEALLQSVFLEMFGNPLINEKGWEVRPLRSVSLKFSDGPFGSDLKTEHYVPKGVRVIRLQNIDVGQLIDDDKAYISEEHFAQLAKHQCLPGDVIVGTLGDPNLRAMILPASIPQALNKADCVQIRVNPKICNNQFVCWLLNMPQTLQLASGMIHGQTRERINMGRLAELIVPIPPLRLQEKFAGVVRRVESLRARMSEAERQVEGLFESLLAQSFHE